MRQFQLREDYPAFPGKCRCGSQASPAVDTLINDAIGRVYLCPRCVAQAAGLHGLVPGEMADTAAEENARLRAHVAELEQRLADASPQVVSVDELLARMAAEQPATEAEQKPRRRAKAAA